VIAADERRKMLAVRLCGERVLMRLESIGVTRLADLRGRDAWELMDEITLVAGRPIRRAPLAVAALQSPIEAAERESTGSPARGGAVHGCL